MTTDTNDTNSNGCGDGVIRNSDAKIHKTHWGVGWHKHWDSNDDAEWFEIRPGRFRHKAKNITPEAERGR